MPEFVVFDLWMDRYILSIDTHDGAMDHTNDPAHARIFRGEEWRTIWGSALRYRLETPKGTA